MVAGDDITLIIDGKAAVGVAVEGKAHVKAVFHYEFLHLFDMGRAAVDIDIYAVGVVVYNISISAESVKHAFCHHPGRAVGTVETDLFALIGTGGKGYEITDIAVSARGIVHGAAYLLAGRIGQAVPLARGGLVDILLYAVKNIVAHFLASSVDELYSVVVIGIVACGDHDAAVEIIGARDI